MAWKQIEPTPAHLVYLILSIFLILYTLFASFVRNRLHLSEPPLALLFGIILGPRGLGWLTPNVRGVNGPLVFDGDDPHLGGWGWGDGIGK
jgi:sodium/hydrogen antiporter